MIKHSSTLEDTSILEIASDLKEKHHCHTVILYGSRARGDYTDTSDYDIAGFCKFIILIIQQEVIH